MSTVQLVVRGTFIDLYEEDPIKLTYSIEDIESTETKSVFSRSFRVPATTHNFEFFSTAFEINGLDFDVTQKYEAIILDNGSELIRGQFRMTKIYRSELTGKIDYECLFLGETRSFGSALGDKMLNQLDLQRYSHLFDIDTVIASWQAYPEGGLTDGIFDGDIIYPLVDFGNVYDSATGAPIYTDMSGEPSGSGGTGFHFTENNTNDYLPANRFKPMIRAKAIWDQIFEEAGYSYTSDFLESELFRKLYISAWGPQASITLAENSLGTFSSRMRFNQFSLGIVGFDDVIFGEGFNTSSHIYTVPTTINGITVPVNSIFTFTSTIRGSHRADSAISEITIRLVHDNAGTITYYDSQTYTAGSVFGSNFFYYANQTITVDPGDQLWVEVLHTFGNFGQIVINSGATFECTNALEGVALANQLKDDYKQIDFVKDIITKFRLVMAPDKDNKDNFIIEPWKDYIASGDYFDWTKKVDLNKDFVIEPLFFTQTEEIDFMDREDQDYLNNLNIEEFAEVFGTLKVDSQNELLKGKREVKTTMPPTPVTQVDPGKYSDGETFIIPQIWISDPGLNEDYPRQKKVMCPHTRLLFYNGLQPTNLKSTGGSSPHPWYTTDGVTGTQHYDFPMVSFYETFPNTASSLNLNWQVETGYIANDGAGYPNTPLACVSAYDVYWNQYITSLYSKWGRRVSVYVDLSSEDLRDFSFDDLVFIKDTYYYVEKIHDVPIGQDALVKVDLIKIERAVNISVVIPPVDPNVSPWNEIESNYNEEDTTWDQL